MAASRTQTEAEGQEQSILETSLGESSDGIGGVGQRLWRKGALRAAGKELLGLASKGKNNPHISNFEGRTNSTAARAFHRPPSLAPAWLQRQRSSYRGQPVACATPGPVCRTRLQNMIHSSGKMVTRVVLASTADAVPHGGTAGKAEELYDTLRKCHCKSHRANQQCRDGIGATVAARHAAAVVGTIFQRALGPLCRSTRSCRGTVL